MAEKFRSLILAGMLAAALSSGYVAGCSKAAAEGKAALNALKAEHAERQREAAEAFAQTVLNTLEKYAEDTRKAQTLAGEIARKDKAHAAETAKLRRRIADATKDNAFVLSPDAVRLLNQAAGVPGNPMPGTADPAHPDGRTAAGSAPDSRLLGTGPVTEADLVAWFLDYAQRARGMEERLAGWRERFAANNGTAREKQ